MSIESINEPGNSRLSMLHPPSINEPPDPAIGDGDFEGTPPRATGMDPLSCAIGDPPLTLTVTGTDFTDQTLIVFDQVPSVTTFVSDIELTLELDPGAFTESRGYPVTVQERGITMQPAMMFQVDEPAARDQFQSMHQERDNGESRGNRGRRRPAGR